MVWDVLHTSKCVGSLLPASVRARTCFSALLRVFLNSLMHVRERSFVHVVAGCSFSTVGGGKHTRASGK